jgi:hypothetical protein
MILKEILRKIFFWKKENNLPEKKAESPKPITEIKIEPRRELSNSSISSIKKEVRTSIIRTQNIARNPSTKPLRGVPKKQSPHQARLWHYKGKIEPEDD